MVATQTKLRRGTEAQVNAMIPAEGEVVVDLTNDRLCLGDGSTSGGIKLPKSLDFQQLPYNFAVAGGTGNAITLTVPLVTSYAQPLMIVFRASATNTSDVTVNVNGLGAKDLYKIIGASIVDVSAGDVVSGGLYIIMYDGVQFQLVNLSSTIGLTSVSQGDLNTSTGSGSASALSFPILFGTGYITSSGSSNGARISAWTAGTSTPIRAITLPGGQYGFHPNVGSLSGSPSYIQRYVNSSPPYDLGDGEVSGFIFLKVNSAGEILEHYSADAPPWAYNGPTDIRATHKCPVTGKKFRKIAKGKRTVDDFMNGRRAKYELQEITNEIKNADMGFIPHPFDAPASGESIILLDPMDDKTARIMEMHNNGDPEMAMEIIRGGYLNIDNTKQKLKCPKGVSIHKFKYKGKK